MVLSILHLLEEDIIKISTISRLIDFPLCVLPKMIVQMSLRRERQTTPSIVAMIRFFSGVHPQMCLEVALFIERALARRKWTCKFFEAEMGLNVNFKSLLPIVGVVTSCEGALIWLVLGMYF